MIFLISLLLARLLLISPSALANGLETHLATGAAAFAKGDYDQAAELFSKAIEQSPELGYVTFVELLGTVSGAEALDVGAP